MLNISIGSVGCTNIQLGVGAAEISLKAFVLVRKLVFFKVFTAMVLNACQSFQLQDENFVLCYKFLA